jgi:hypothetical protein
MSFRHWAVAQLDATRVRLALHCLQLSGFEIYAPRLRQRRVSRGRKIETKPLLFTSYVFVFIVIGGPPTARPALFGWSATATSPPASPMV